MVSEQDDFDRQGAVVTPEEPEQFERADERLVEEGQLPADAVHAKLHAVHHDLVQLEAGQYLRARWVRRADLDRGGTRSRSRRFAADAGVNTGGSSRRRNPAPDFHDVRATRFKSRRGDVAPQAAGQVGTSNPALVGALRKWRSEVARQRGVPAYVVLHDATIDGIAAARPTTSAQLRGIPGIGDKKLEHYGDELLALVKGIEG